MSMASSARMPYVTHNTVVFKCIGGSQESSCVEDCIDDGKQSIYFVFATAPQHANVMATAARAFTSMNHGFIHVELLVPQTKTTYCVDAYLNRVAADVTKPYKIESWSFWRMRVDRRVHEAIVRSCERSLGLPYSNIGFYSMPYKKTRSFIGTVLCCSGRKKAPHLQLTTAYDQGMLYLEPDTPVICSSMIARIFANAGLLSCYDLECITPDDIMDMFSEHLEQQSKDEVEAETGMVFGRDGKSPVKTTSAPAYIE